MTDIATPPGAVAATHPKKGRDEKLSSDNDLIRIKVFAPYKVYFDDDAYSISAVNDTGPFDVLARHHNFITLINPCILNIKLKDGEQRIRIARGLMHVKKDKITVFIDI